MSLMSQGTITRSLAGFSQRVYDERQVCGKENFYNIDLDEVVSSTHQSTGWYLYRVGAYLRSVVSGL